MSFVGPSEWRQLAACRGVDPELFFPAVGDPGTQAKAVCKRCPVVEPCLDYALNFPERFGIFGGLSERERRRIRRRRPPLPRLCQWAPCQVSFTPTNGSQVYHSPACQAAAAGARKVPSRRVG